MAIETFWDYALDKQGAKEENRRIMTPDDIARASARMRDRLIQTGFAESHAVDLKAGKGAILWTPEGIVLRDALKKIFDVPNVRPHEIPPENIFALILGILAGEPPKH